MFTCEVDSAALIQAWVGVRANVRAGVRRGVSQGVTEGAREAQALHSFRNRTSNLERSIVGKLTGTRTSVGAARGNNNRVRSMAELPAEVDGAQFGEIRAGMEYASYVEEGTRPHVIYPRRASVLSWIGYDGTRVFARYVNHPGSRPYPFMHHASEKCFGVMVREIHRGIWAAQEILDR